MDQMRATFARMITMRPTTIEGMRAIASAVCHFEWDGDVESTEGAIEGAALAVLVHAEIIGHDLALRRDSETVSVSASEIRYRT